MPAVAKMTRSKAEGRQNISPGSNFYKNLSTKRHYFAQSCIYLILFTTHSMQKFFKSGETFAQGASSIRVQPERRAALGQSEIFKKNPAVAAAGP